MPDFVRIGCYAAFWGDTRGAAAQLLREGDPDYLVADYLSEITMALLARARAKDPSAGYVKDAVDVLAPLLPEIHRQGVKVVTNAGALNPAACAQALRDAAAAAGVPLRVVAVEGDDLIEQADALRRRSATDMFTGEPFPEQPMTINAYLGARPIATALSAGADIVVTGRCVDTAVLVGPLVHAFGWSDDDYDLLSAGTLVGHIVECGPQGTGGNSTDWRSIPGWDDIGYPIAECYPDGTAVVTKPAGTGGRVSPATVGEQVLYEIGDPGAYLMPDVACDWRGIRLVQDGEDRVHVSGARGQQPPTTYKATVTYADGYRSMTTAMFSGFEAAGRARRAGEALVARSERLMAEAGIGPFAEASIEVIGAGDTRGAQPPDDAADEAVVKIGVRHADRAALEIFSMEFAPFALVAQGMTGFFGGRPRIAPVIRVFHVLVEKDQVAVQLRFDDHVEPVAIAAGRAGATFGTPTLPDGDGTPPPGGVTVPLRRIAYGRSGDKGDQANIGVIARTPELVPIVQAQLTAARVAEAFAHYADGPVRRWEVPGMGALNFLIDNALGGAGGTSTLRYDPQGKSYAAMLLALPVVVPAALLPDEPAAVWGDGA